MRAGGNKRDFYGSDLWVLKYLHGFKWHHLTEKIGAWQAHPCPRFCSWPRGGSSLPGRHRVGRELQRQAAGGVDRTREMRRRQRAWARTVLPLPLAAPTLVPTLVGLRSAAWPRLCLLWLPEVVTTVARPARN